VTTKAYRANYDLIEWKPLQRRPGLAREARARGPYFIPDIEPYVSPLDGSVVGSRSHHRDHMRAHGVVEAGTDKPKPTTVKPLPDVRQDIREAYEMLKAGYSQRPLL